MWQSIKNISKVVADLTVIGSKEIVTQVSKANNYSDSITSKLAAKTAAMRQAYENDKETTEESKCQCQITDK